MKTVLIFILLSAQIPAWASTLQLRGAFFPKASEKKSVSFRLRWVEEDGKLTGFYSDDRFSQRAPVTGLVTDSGRTFEILLPRTQEGIKSFSLLSSSIGSRDTATTIPVELVARDERGNPLRSARFDAQFSVETPRPARRLQAQEERPCTGGFGELSGYCGRYGGMISELQDSGQLCDFMTYKDVRLELDNEANVIFHTAQPDDKHFTQDHLIGRVPSETATRSVDLMSRHCRPLPGTNFPGDDCKRVNLVGVFTSRDGTPHFSGTYTIIDERTEKSCRYSLTLDRVQRI